MNKEAIILAGGLGTRLSSVVKDIPKPMALVNEKPFLEYILTYLKQYNINRAILSVGYKYEIIRDYFGDNFNGIELVYAVEEEPLGTGGGIMNGINHCKSENVFIINGDTFFKVDLNKLFDLHKNNNSDLTLSLKEMNDFDRYGTVKLDGNKITGFSEKRFIAKGNINGGVYVINKDKFRLLGFPEKFSFETDFMEKYTNELNFNGMITDNYFIDIGIPSDYNKAQEDFKSF